MKPQILFVDDESLILRGLERNLRSKVKEWDISFVNNGKEALKILDAKTIDVIISDLRMPEMDGVELLQKVAQKNPLTFRFILSGYYEREILLRGVGPSHYYFFKPSKIPELCAEIERAILLKKRIENPQIERLIEHTPSLLKTPKTYQGILTAAKDPSFDIEKLISLISKDHPLSMTIKKIAMDTCSEHFGDIKEIIDIFGIEAVRGLVMFSGFITEFSPTQSPCFDVNAFYQKSIHYACLAKKDAIHKNAPLASIQSSFIAGLLHDLGTFLVALHLPCFCQKTTFEIRDDINIKLTDLASYLLVLWGINLHIVEAVAGYCDPLQDFSSFSQTLQILNQVHVHS